jgi:serine/threonine protein kinase
MTNPERLQEILAGAIALPPARRAAYLDAACRGDAPLRAEAEAALALHLQAGLATDAPTQGIPGSEAATVLQDGGTMGHAADLREGPGSRIGPYKLLQIVGEGGFGTVFMAEQEEPVRRKVALKIIKLGMDTRQVVARFEQERQALAMMDHPNIARVLDAGATETGRPFFVMELVKGDPIVEYCDKNNLSINERLELLAEVCSAVQHAHTKGIIHRDIKPSNVLVSTQDGKPHTKVIDFGVAKATAAKLTEMTLFTEHRQMIGTPEYMSPEQAEGSLDIDTRTDVYALGVLAYELLTGTTPFSGSELRSAAYAEIQRIIREVDPPKPSARLGNNTETLAGVAARRHTEPQRLGAIVRGEIDWIVMKALEKDRQRRYETANGLAMDIRRYLAGEAVVAAPPSRAYRFRKFVRRNRVIVTAGGTVAAALVAVSVVTAVAAYRLNVQKQELAREKTISDQRLETYRTTVSQLVNRAPQLLEGAPVGSGTREELLALVRSALQESEDAGAVGPARRYGLAAVAIREGDRLRSQAVADLAQSDRLEIASDRLKQAAEKYTEAERIFREVYDSHPEDASKAAANLATGLSGLASVLALQSKPMAEVVPVHKSAVALRRESLAAARPDDKDDVARRTQELGTALTNYAAFLFANRSADVQRFAARSLELTTESCGLLQDAVASQPASSDIGAGARADLADALSLRAMSAEALGQFDEAARSLAEAVAVCRQLCADHPNRYSYRARLVTTANRYGDYLLGHNADAKEIARLYALAMQALRQTLAEPEMRDLQNGSNGLAMQFYRLGLAELLQGDRGKAREQFAHCALLREMAWHDSLDELQGAGQSDRLITQRIELMLAQARGGQADSAIAHARWLFDRAGQLTRSDPATRTQAGGFSADQLFVFSAAGFGLASEQVAPGRRTDIVRSAIESTALAIRSGYRDADYLLRDPDFAPLRTVKEFRDLVAGMGGSRAK